MMLRYFELIFLQYGGASVALVQQGGHVQPASHIQPSMVNFFVLNQPTGHKLRRNVARCPNLVQWVTNSTHNQKVVGSYLVSVNTLDGNVVKEPLPASKSGSINKKRKKNQDSQINSQKQPSFMVKYYMLYCNILQYDEGLDKKGLFFMLLDDKLTHV